MEDFEGEDLEADIEKPAVKYAISRGWLEIKIMRANIRGWPDRIFLRAGRVIWVEFKRPGKEPSKQQAKRHKEIREHGGEVYWIDNLEAAYVLFK